MDIVLDKFRDATEWWQWVLTKADKRVENWFLMDNYATTWVLTGLYLLAVWQGKNFMKNKSPLTMPKVLFVYNMGLVVLNFHIFYELFTCTWRRNYSYSCQPVDYSDNPDEVRIAKALWWYYFSKCIEFMDTLFFVVRKKNNQISFLHVYHHATMFPIWWIGVKFVPGGQSFFGAMINSFIHVIMYTYYGVSALGPEYQKYLWWKKYLTRMQLVQFIMGMAHAGQSLVQDCQFPRWMQWALIFYGFSILCLFLNFYFHTYIHASKKAKPEANGHMQRNGALRNGHAKKTN